VFSSDVCSCLNHRSNELLASVAAVDRHRVAFVLKEVE